MSPFFLTDRWEWEEDRPARRYSYRESACLQGFSDNMVFPDTAVMRTKYKVVGNPVPPLLFEAVVRALPDIW